jgi:tartrate dehydrogenase/decarboxylase/D-malate dehydrogenase
MKSYRIASIPGDGIGNEVIPAGLEVLDALASREKFSLESTLLDWSSMRYKETGAYIPAGGLERLKTFDAIFFGAVGAPDVPDHISLWELRLAICQGFDQYANVRPSRVLPGITSPLKNGAEIDWVIVRENSEGEYSGAYRPSPRGGDGGLHLHAPGRRAHPPLRLRAGEEEAAQALDARHQVERAAPRHGALG